MAAADMPLEVYYANLQEEARLQAEYNAAFPTPVAYIYIVLTMVLCIAKPRLGFVLVVGSVLLRFQDRVEALQTFPMFLALTLCLMLGMVLNKKDVLKPQISIDKPMLYFLLFVAFGLLFMAPGTLIRNVYVLWSSMMFYYFATRLVTNEDELRRVTLFIALCCTLLGVEALVAVMGDPEVSAFYGGGGRLKRLQGLGYYGNANELGMLMIMGIPFLVAVLMGKSGLIKRLLAAAMIGALVLAMAKTESRTAMVCFALMIGIMMIFRSGGNVFKKMILGGIFGLVLIVGLSFVPGPIQERLGSIANYEEDASFQGRVRSWGHGLDMAIWYPLTGVGMNQWGNYHGLASHNSYVCVLAETGFIGFILYLRIIFASFRQFRGLDSPRLEMRRKLVALSVLASFSGYLLYIFFGNQSYNVPTFLYLGLCGAVGNLGLHTASEGADAAPEVTDKRLRQRNT